MMLCNKKVENLSRNMPQSARITMILEQKGRIGLMYPASMLRVYQEATNGQPMAVVKKRFKGCLLTISESILKRGRIQIMKMKVMTL